MIKDISELSDSELETIASWDYGHWGYRRDYQTFQSTIDFYKQSQKLKAFPYVLVAWDKLRRIPQGMVSLMTDDVHAPSRDNITPYLVSLYVQERYRGQSVGTQLVSEAESLCVKLEYDSIYCNTRNACDFLSNLGWNTLETVSNKEHEIPLYFMKKNLV